MKIEQYILMTYYYLWEVILNGDSPTPTIIVDCVVQVIAPTTTEQRLAKKNELMARGTLLMALPDKHQLKFNIYKDAKSLMEAIEKRLQKLISQLEILGKSISQEDINLKFLRSLPSEWKTHTLIWRNKVDLEKQSLDDLFNNLKIYKAEVKGSSTSSHNIQNIAFMSLNNTDITNELVNVVPSVFAASFQAPDSTLQNIDSLSDIMAMLTMRARRFLQKTGRNLGANGTTAIGFYMSKVECYNFHRIGHFARDYRSPRDNKNKDTPRRTVPVEADEEHNNYALMAYTSSGSSSSSGSDNENFYASKPDLVFNDAPKASETVTNVVNVELSSHKPNKDMSKPLRLDAPIIEDCTSDSEDESEIEYVPKQNEPSFVQTSKHVKTPRASVKLVEHPKQAENLRTENQKSRGCKNSWNRKACFICKSLNHLIKDYDYCEKQMVQKPMWNNAMRIQVSHGLGPQKTLSFLFDVQGNPQQALKDKCVINSGCSRHMTGNISYLSYFEAFNRGYVAFGGNLKGATEYVVLSFDYKQPDENHVLLRVLKENNMYNVDLKNVVPSGGLTGLFAKATLDESNIWHRRLGHINFKTMNKLVKGNLVRGLPSKLFENNHTWVACKKGKIHRASWSGPQWFDIDTLTQSMTYQPLAAGYQPNHNAGIKENLDADPKNTDDVATFGVKENENAIHVSPSRSDETKKHDDKAKGADKGKSPVDLSTGVRDLRDEFKEISFNSTNRVNAASAPVAAAGPNPTSNTNSFNTASPSDTDVSLNFGIDGKSSFVYPSNYPDDPNMPALEDIVYSDNEEDVGADADFSNLETNISVSPIPTTRGHTQEEGTDYNEVFSPVARIEAIWLFLTYASFMGFMVYQMDVKSAFLYGTIEEEVYVCQPLGFEDPAYPDKVTRWSKNSVGCIKLLELEKPLLKDPDGEDVDVHIDSDYAGARLDRKFATGDDADGVECLPNEEIFAELARMGYEKPPPKLTFYKEFFSAQWKFLIHTLVQCVSAKRTAWNKFSCSMAASVICLATVMINNQVDDLSSHTTKYTSPTLTQKVFANMRRIGKGFSRMETPLFASMLVQPQPQAVEEAYDVEEQPTDTSKSSMTFLNTLMETYATMSQKVSQLEQDKIAQALEILKLKKRVKKLERKRRLKSSGLKRLRKGRKDDDSDASKDVSAAEPTVFDDEEVTMTMAQTLIKMKAEKTRLLDEQMAKKLHDEEVKKAVAREKQEKDDLEKAKGLQQ
nr:ribonuclease H-like domain-containing protein [Tanacetum cinerariifolium]